MPRGSNRGLRLLLDTHALIWLLAGDRRLPKIARSAIDDASNPVFVSAASAWEISTKHRLGRLPGASAFTIDPGRALADQGFEELPISIEAGTRAGLLPGPIRDPFDRMLIAQAMLQDLVLVSNEAQFDGYGVRRHW